MRLRAIYPKFIKFLEGHAELDQLCRDHLIGNYIMPPSLALPIIGALCPDDVEMNLTDDNVGEPIDYSEDVDAVLISCFTPQAQRAYEIADAFRKEGTTVVIGGIHPSGAPEEALRHADAVCVGEVEVVWDHILADLREKKARGIYQGEPLSDLSKVPTPRWRLFNSQNYLWEAGLVWTTRGCPVKCSDCPIPNKEDVSLRYRAIDDVVRDIKSLPFREFYLTDDTVMLPSKRSRKWLEKLIARTSELDVNIFLASTMMMYPDPDYYKLLAHGGGRSMYTVFGYDRMSRELFSKDCSRDIWQLCVDLVRMNEDAGIHFFASIGLGFENHDEGVFDRVMEFIHDANIDLAEFFIHTPFPGTPFGARAEKEKKILHRNYNQWNTGNVVFRPELMSPEKLLEGFYYCWKEFYRGKEPTKTLRSFDKVKQWDDDIVTINNREVS